MMKLDGFCTPLTRHLMNGHEQSVQFSCVNLGYISYFANSNFVSMLMARTVSSTRRSTFVKFVP